MNILALDTAIKTGYCTPTTSGVIDCSVKRDQSKGMRLIIFRSEVEKLIDEHEITLVVYERPTGKRHIAKVVAANFEGVLQTLCIDKGVEYTSMSPGEVKLFATGNGNANKQIMIDACIEELDIVPEDDNEADACWIYEKAKSDFNVS